MENSIKCYKLFRTLKTKPGKIFPLFIGKSKPTEIGVVIPAEDIPTKGFAHRPGWHVGRLPKADHLLRKDGTQAPGRVWAEVEIPADDYFVFIRPKHQGGEWLIAGSIQVNRLLSESEVNQILEDASNLK